MHEKAELRHLNSQYNPTVPDFNYFVTAELLFFITINLNDRLVDT